MTVVASTIATDSDAFRENRASMLTFVDRLRDLEQRTVTASSKRNPTFDKRGQIPPHQRVVRLLDPGMPFLRLHSMANYCLEDENPETSIPGASMVVGIGFVSGVRCMIWADDSGIAAGAATEATVDVALSIQDV